MPTCIAVCTAVCRYRPCAWRHVAGGVWSAVLVSAARLACDLRSSSGRAVRIVDRHDGGRPVNLGLSARRRTATRAVRCVRVQAFCRTPHVDNGERREPSELEGWVLVTRLSADSWLGIVNDKLYTGSETEPRRAMEVAGPVGLLPLLEHPHDEVMSDLSAREAELGLAKGALAARISLESLPRVAPSTLTSTTGFNSLSTGARRATRFTRTAPFSKPWSRPTGQVREPSTAQRS